jgi:hypothetical protein
MQTNSGYIKIPLANLENLNANLEELMDISEHIRPQTTEGKSLILYMKKIIMETIKIELDIEKALEKK